MPMPCSPDITPAQLAGELMIRATAPLLRAHLVVVGVHGDVRVHVPVARVHVQGDEDAATQDLAVGRLDHLHDRLEVAPGEEIAKGFAQLLLPRDAIAVQLHILEGRRIVQVIANRLPALARRTNELDRLGLALTHQLGAHGQVACEEVLQALAELQLVREGKLDVDALDSVGVVAQPLERDHDVLVDLESVRVPGDRGGACAVQPEALALLGGDGDEALALARVGDAHYVRCRAGRRVLIVAHDVAQQDHAWAAAALRLGGVSHGLHVALIQVLEAGEDRLGMRIEIALDLDDGWHRLLHVAEEFEAHGTHVLRHAMQDERGRGDEAVASLLLHARQAAQELVGHVLAQAFLAQALAFDFEKLLAPHAPGGVEVTQAESRQFRVVDAAAIVVEALHLEPITVGRDHAPRREVVQGRAPEHCLLSARVHGDVAADARGIGRGRVHREDEAAILGRLHHAPGHDASSATDHGARLLQTRQHAFLDGLEAVELFRVDHGREPVEGNRPARVAGAAAARNDREPSSISARTIGAHSSSVSGLTTTNGYSTRQSVASVTWDTRAMPSNWTFVAAGDCAQPPHDLAAEASRAGEFALEGFHRGARGVEQVGDSIAALLVGAALVDLVQAMVHGADQQREAARIVEKVVLQVGLRRTTQMSPSTSYSIRADRPVTRSPRSSSSACQAGSPSSRITISRSEYEV